MVHYGFVIDFDYLFWGFWCFGFLEKPIVMIEKLFLIDVFCLFVCLDVVNSLNV